jgi:hypothetical protein
MGSTKSIGIFMLVVIVLWIIGSFMPQPGEASAIALGNCGNPCIVAGKDAVGGASSSNPVQIAGNDGTDVRAITTDASGRSVMVGSAAVGAVPSGNPVQVGVYDGTDMRLPLSAGAGSLTTQPMVGAAIHEKGARWQVHNANTGTAASATEAAGASGVRHVADCISFAASAGSSAASAAGFVDISIEDGATVIWQLLLGIGTGTDAQLILPTTFCGLNLIGTAATSMTVLFSGSATNLGESVVLTGFDVQ